MVGSMVDLTDRKRSEAAVQEGARRIRVLMNAVPAFVWMADGNGSVQQFNARWHDYTGVTLEEVRQGKWRRVVHPDDREDLVRKWSQSVQSGLPYEHELRMRGRDGQYRWFVSRALPVQDDTGTVVGWYGTTVDIEDRRRMEDERAALLASERAARKEAEQANRMKDEFLATLSHEIRTPMSAILGWVQVLRTGDNSNMDASIAHGLEVIERNARAQAQLIEDLLDMSRVISGKLRLDGRDVDLVEVIEAATGTVHPAAVAKRITIRTNLMPAHCVVYGDATRLQQMVWNLLTNAVKFTGAGGTIEIALQTLADRAQIEVRDNGEGIDPEFLPHLFERFRQADSSTTRRFGGLGLGLAIVKQLTELHGGTVRAASEGLGCGAVFTIELPLSPSGMSSETSHEGSSRLLLADRSSGRSAPVHPRQSGRILLVEDEEDTREAMTRLLERNGYRVSSVSNAARALDALRDYTPEVLISDIGMPGMDGHELIRLIRERPADDGGNVLALALTAFTRSEDRECALRAGYDAHLGKPVDESELLLCLRRIRRRGTTRNERGGQPTTL
jgi:PAS domain S-box-containing protein